jgi:glycosyltransferase XagB
MHRRGMATLDRVLLLLPVYYVLISAASWVALLDLAIRPFYWAKTKHGQSRKGRAIAPPHGAAS